MSNQIAVEDAPYARAKRIPGLLTSWPAIEDFIFAGNATFTLVSKKTGVRFTYRVKVKKYDQKRLHLVTDPVKKAQEVSEAVYFLNLLRGPSNETDYSYMGVLRKDPVRYFWTAASGKVGRLAPAYKALGWFVDAAKNRRDVLGSQLEVWHEGRCGRCGRKLTVPGSIAAGLGPECAGRK